VKRTLIIVVAAVIALTLIWRPPGSASISQSSPSPSFSPRTSRGAHLVLTEAVVYITGAVKRPGLYRLRAGARADDGVRAAGGMLAAADPTGVNLAQRVSDGEEILVPLLGEPTMRVRGRRKARSKLLKSNAAPAIVDLNSASAEMLASIPGIGKTIAARIIDVRERDGAYQSLDELLDVAGMTQKRLERAEQFLHI
jgi:competence protein ComEA